MSKRKLNKAQANQIDELINLLGSDDLETRVAAIEILGHIGDEQALQKLRDRLTPVNRELKALVIAVGNLKRKLGVK